MTWALILPAKDLGLIHVPRQRYCSCLGAKAMETTPEPEFGVIR
jgi:hypothetical protein